MFQKLKKQATEAYNQGKEKVQEKKREYYDKKNQGWRNEIIKEDKNFKTVPEWFELYEKQSSKNKEDSKSSQALQQKMNEVMVNKMTDNVMWTIMESLALATEAAAMEIKQQEEGIYAILNGITGVFLTYRFQYKNKKKFKYLRGVCVDRIAITFTEFIDNEAKKLGKDPSEIGPEAAQKIIDKVVDILSSEIEKKKDLTIKKFKQSTLFNMSGLDNNDEIDEIIKMVVDIIQTFGEQKIEECLGGLRQELPKLFSIVVQHQEGIRANLAYQAKYGENSQEYDEKTRDVMLAQIDSSYKLLKNYVKTFIGRFSGLITNNIKEEEKEQE